MELKECHKCGEIKLLVGFSKHKLSKDGYQDRCKECNKKYGKEYYKNNLEKEKERVKKYRSKNKEKEIEKMRIWRIKNSIRARMINRRSDQKNKLSRRFYTLIYRSLKRKSLINWENMLGYNRQDLKSHLEKLFKPGMSWNNYGEWEIDHIIPIYLWQFNTPNDREFKQCWALVNIQPLWKEENKIKGKRIDLYMTDVEEAIEFGRQKLMVKVVK